MKIFLDIGHPAHVHYFKHLIREMENDGHQFVITARDKEVTHYLLQREGFSYHSRGKGEEGLLGKIVYTFKANKLLYIIAKKEKPDLFFSFASPYCAHVAFLMRKPHITLDDTETARIGQAMYRPFSDVILTPVSFLRDFGKKQIRFPSFIEMAYLHPNRFTPDSGIYKELGLKEAEPYVIMRFVGWTANHDIGQKGISVENRIKAAEEFSRYAKVFISSENDLPAELSKYRIEISPDRIHHAIAFSSLLYGESGTMASEAAMLGTPALIVNNLAGNLGTLKMQADRYDLISCFDESDSGQKQSIQRGLELLKTDKSIWTEKKDQIVKENIDMTAFLFWFIAHYPNSSFEFSEFIDSFSY